MWMFLKGCFGGVGGGEGHRGSADGRGRHRDGGTTCWGGFFFKNFFRSLEQVDVVRLYELLMPGELLELLPPTGSREHEAFFLAAPMKSGCCMVPASTPPPYAISVYRVPFMQAV